MKYFLVLCAFLLSFDAAAKYNQPPGIPTRAEKNAKYMFEYMDTNKEGKITLEQFKNVRMTRDVEKRIRKEKDEGTYVSPEDQFKAMDSDEDGFITQGDYMSYIKSRGMEPY